MYFSPFECFFKKNNEIPALSSLSMWYRYDKERAIQLLHSRLHDFSPQIPEGESKTSVATEREAGDVAGHSHTTRNGRASRKGHSHGHAHGHAHAHAHESEHQHQGPRRAMTPSPAASRSSSASRASKESEELAFKTPNQLVPTSNSGIIYIEKKWQGLPQLEERLYGTSPVQ